MQFNVQVFIFLMKEGLYFILFYKKCKNRFCTTLILPLLLRILMVRFDYCFRNNICIIEECEFNKFVKGLIMKFFYKGRMLKNAWHSMKSQHILQNAGKSYIAGYIQPYIMYHIFLLFFINQNMLVNQ